MKATNLVPGLSSLQKTSLKNYMVLTSLRRVSLGNAQLVWSYVWVVNFTGNLNEPVNTALLAL